VVDSIFKEKVGILNDLGTKEAVGRLDAFIEEIAALQTTRQQIVNANADFISSGSRDCEAVKALEAELFLQVPDNDQQGKRMTIDQRTSWFETSKRHHAGWLAALKKQREMASALANLDAQIEITSRKYSATKSFLELRTAQISFLSK
jgi:hypothetical protein